MAKLTKSQIAFLAISLNEPASPTPRLERSLTAAGLVEKVGEDGDYALFRPSRAGLEALLDYWMRKDAALGCLAHQERRQEVEAALASRFPEPLKLAA